MSYPSVIDLGLGEVRLRMAASRSMEERYAPLQGIGPLRAAIAARHGVSPDAVTVTTGASMALTATLATLARPASVLIPRPYFPAYPAIVELLGMTPIYYDVGPSPTDVSLILPSRLPADTRAMLINFPGNPLGNVPSVDGLATIAELARGKDLLLISDEVYADFVYDVPYAKLALDAGLSVVHIRSFSKAFAMPGQRLGYAIAEPPRVATIARAHWHMAMSAPGPAQIDAAHALLSDSGGARDTWIAQLRRNRDHAAAALSMCSGVSVSAPPAGLFLWVRLDERWGESPAVAQQCAEHGVLVTPGIAFGVERPTCLRVSFAVSPKELEVGLTRLAEVLAAGPTNRRSLTRPARRTLDRAGTNSQAGAQAQ